jgi:predicted naringenin-chalcone synthase
MTATAYVNRIGTATPSHDVHEAFVTLGRDMLADDKSRQVFERMVERCAIDHRWSHFQPGDPGTATADTSGFYRRGSFPSTGARMKQYAGNAVDLALAAIADSGISTDGITHLIAVSCTGFIAPGLDQVIADRLGLGGALERTMIGFMGCYAGVPALRAARHIIRSDPDARVLVVNVELCSLHMQETSDLETVLTFLLFGDGATAALVTAEPHGLALHDFRSTVLPGTQDLITWQIGDQGFDMHLSGKVPARIATALRAEADRNDADGLLRGEDPRDIPLWAVHAGGRTVLDGVEQGLRLAADALDYSRGVLRDVGNMSSATLMFVLARILAGDAVGRGMAIAFGPGLAAETFRFTRV